MTHLDPESTNLTQPVKVQRPDDYDEDGSVSELLVVACAVGVTAVFLAGCIWVVCWLFANLPT
jgi:hypothetical protein